MNFSRTRKAMGVEDVQKLNNIVGIDLFLYTYAIAAKNREVDDDVDFMALLRVALVDFKKRKAEAKAAAEAAASLAFDDEAGPSHQDEKREKYEKKEKSKPKVREFTK